MITNIKIFKYMKIKGFFLFIDFYPLCNEIRNLNTESIPYYFYHLQDYKIIFFILNFKIKCSLSIFYIIYKRFLF